MELKNIDPMNTPLPNPLEAMIVDTLANPQVFTMLIITHLSPSSIVKLASHMTERQSMCLPMDAGVAYDFLQSIHGGLVRNDESVNPREYFRSLLIAVLKGALTDGGENG